MNAGTAPWLEEFIPLRLDATQPCRRVPLAHGVGTEAGDLFARETGPLFSPELAGYMLVPAVARFKISESLTISVDVSRVSASAVQCLIAVLAAASTNVLPAHHPPIRPFILDEDVSLTMWTCETSLISLAADLWKAIADANVVDEAEIDSTPKLYGGKTKLTPLLLGAACSVLPPGASILDVMSGTGVVARKLSARFEVSTNDANPYAALLSRAQGAQLSFNIDCLVSALRRAYESNYQALVALASTEFRREADFLHGDLTLDRLAEYKEFCERPVLAVCGPPSPPRPYRLCTARYSNVYFGLSQAAQLDSLRFGIDEVAPEAGDDRDLCLSALIIAASVCNSGPHFAQPVRLSTLKMFRQTIERRARDIAWEFELALRRLTARPPLRTPLRDATQLDWREAVDRFTRSIGSRRPAAVYFDPPYSKLQYSRYYHVLNVLISYDYPSVGGVGRYPPLKDRFSSRFEHRPRTAEREFSEAFELCRAHDLAALVSYSDRGFVPINDLSNLMQENFREVCVFSEAVRHHSQGVRLGDHQGRVTEFVLVGRT